MMFGRKLAVEYTEFFRKYVPGCEEIELLTTAPVMGVRDTRRIVGEFELTIEDFKSARQFPDQVAVYNRPTDVHPTDTSEKEFKRFLTTSKASTASARATASACPTASWCRRAGAISGSRAAATRATPRCTARSARSPPPT